MYGLTLIRALENFTQKRAYYVRKLMFENIYILCKYQQIRFSIKSHVPLGMSISTTLHIICFQKRSNKHQFVQWFFNFVKRILQIHIIKLAQFQYYHKFSYLCISLYKNTLSMNIIQICIVYCVWLEYECMIR